MARDVAVQINPNKTISQGTSIILTGGRGVGNLYQADTIRSQVAGINANPMTDVQLAARYTNRFKGV